MVTVSAVMAVSGTGTALAATDFVNSGPGVGLGDLESGGVIDTTTPESDGSQSGSGQNNDGQAGNEENGDGQTAEETAETVPEDRADLRPLLMKTALPIRPLILDSCMPVTAWEREHRSPILPSPFRTSLAILLMVLM